jgi:hypothetical protein
VVTNTYLAILGVFWLFTAVLSYPCGVAALETCLANKSCFGPPSITVPEQSYGWSGTCDNITSHGSWCTAACKPDYKPPPSNDSFWTGYSMFAQCWEGEWHTFQGKCVATLRHGAGGCEVRHAVVPDALQCVTQHGWDCGSHQLDMGQKHSLYCKCPCAEGYIGNPVFSCQNYTWTYIGGKCMPDTSICPPVNVTVDNAHGQGDWPPLTSLEKGRHGQIVYKECPPGYGGNKVPAFQCQSGSWVQVAGECEPALGSCPPLSETTVGSNLSAWKCWDPDSDYTSPLNRQLHGSTCSKQCEAGSARPKYVCSAGVWIHSSIVCGQDPSQAPACTNHPTLTPLEHTTGWSSCDQQTTQHGAICRAYCRSTSSMRFATEEVYAICDMGQWQVGGPCLLTSCTCEQLKHAYSAFHWWCGWPDVVASGAWVAGDCGPTEVGFKLAHCKMGDWVVGGAACGCFCLC